MEDWTRHVDRHFHTIVQTLRPSLILDHLRSNGLLNREEYSQLQEMTHECDRSRRLINTMLPSKGPGSLKTFCQILLSVQGQEHIVTDIIGREQAGDGPHVTAVSATTPPFVVVPLERKRKQQDDYCDAPVPSGSKQLKSEAPKGATFWFKEEDRKRVERELKGSILLMCEDFFGITEDDVEFLYDNKPGSRFPFYGDLQSKIAVLDVFGVEPAKMKQHLYRLIRSMASCLKVNVKQIHCLEVLDGSTFIVFSLPREIYSSLLLALADRRQRVQLDEVLQRALPKGCRAVYRLGGLPPMEVITPSKIVSVSAV